MRMFNRRVEQSAVISYLRYKDLFKVKRAMGSEQNLVTPMTKIMDPKNNKTKKQTIQKPIVRVTKNERIYALLLLLLVYLYALNYEDYRRWSTRARREMVGE